MNKMTKGYVTVQLKTQEFLKDNRGSVIEYVMVIALAGILVASVQSPLNGLVTELVAAAKKSVTGA